MTGTEITFLPSTNTFTKTEFDFTTLEHRLRELAFLNSGVTLVLTDLRGAEPKTVSFHYDGGLEAFVQYLDRSKQALHAPPIAIRGERDGIIIEIAMEWTNSYHETMLCFTNNIPQRDGGTHLAGFRAALTRTVNAYASDSGIAKKEKVALSGEDMREGLSCILSVKLPDPKFSSQTKDKLVSSEVRPRDRGSRRRAPPAMVRGAPGRRPQDRREGRRGGGGARGGPQGARPDPPQERARRREPARQARRLPGARPGEERIVHRRGRQRRRLGQAGPRPPLPGDPAAQGQNPQCRARPLRQDAVLGRDRHLDPGARHRHRQRGFRGRKGALSPHHHHDRRRCRRQPYPHAAVDVLLPADAGADRKGLSVHRAAAALPPAARQRQAGLSEGRRGARSLSVQHGDPRRRVHDA